MQSHSMDITPVQIKQLSATVQQKSLRTQKQSETKLVNKK